MTHRQAADAILQAEDHIKLYLHRPKDPHWWKASSDQSLSVSSSPLSSTTQFQAIEQCRTSPSIQSESPTCEDVLEPDLVSDSPKLLANEDIFDVTLKKGDCGFGFRLDKSKSNRESEFDR